MTVPAGGGPRRGATLAARPAAPGEQFTVEGTRYRRTGRDHSHWRPAAVFVTALSDAHDDPGPRFDAEREEDNAFWCGKVMSVPKLREKYDALRLEAKRERDEAASGGGRPKRRGGQADDLSGEVYGQGRTRI